MSAETLAPAVMRPGPATAGVRRQLHGVRALRGTVLRGERHVRFLRYVADRLSRGDRDLRDDLLQEGLIALWRAPETTAGLPAGEAERVERRVVVHRMLHWVRQERRTRSWVRGGAGVGR